jgi:predicted lipoprotein with Yx(FWY)xxD motif
MHRRRFLAATAGLVALAGCTTGTEGGQQDTTTESATTTAQAETTTESGETETTEATGSDATTTEAMADDPTVAVGSTEEYGDILVDSEGMSLYLFTQDEEGTSTCYGDCEDAWPPLTVEGDPSAGSDVTASLGTTERDDGSMQVTAEGWPLYYYAGDSEPGDTEGQGVGDVWFLVTPDGAQVAGGGTTTDTTTTATTTDDGGGGGY